MTLPDRHLTSALRKRELGVPTYSVAEAAALLSVNTMSLYRAIRQDGFPAVTLRGRG